MSELYKNRGKKLDRQKAVQVLEEKIIPHYGFSNHWHSEDFGKKVCPIGGLLTACGFNPADTSDANMDHYGRDGTRDYSVGYASTSPENKQTWDRVFDEYGDPETIGLDAIAEVSKNWDDVISILRTGRTGYKRQHDAPLGLYTYHITDN